MSEEAREREEVDFKRELERLAVRAIGVLASLMNDTEQKPELRMKAAESILDRVCGKAGGTAPVASEGIPDCVRFEGELEEWSQ